MYGEIMNEDATAEEQAPKTTQDIHIILVGNEGDFIFKNIIGHQVGSQWVAVFTEDGRTVIVNNNRIASIVVTPTTSKE